MTSAQLVPAVLVPFIAWRVYRRYQRNVGRQRFQPRRLALRIGFFSVLTVLIGMACEAHAPALLALGGGLLGAVPLALAGLHLTKFETTPEGKSYTPNTAIGITLLVLFVGRIGYRFFALAGSLSAEGAPPPPPLFQSPLTLAVFGLTAGYYIAYSTGVLVRGNRRG